LKKIFWAVIECSIHIKFCLRRHKCDVAYARKNNDIFSEIVEIKIVRP
jgi:hypothetical protein